MKPPYKIEKNVPRQSKRMSDYNWLEAMEVGDSFVMPAENIHNTTDVQIIYNWGMKHRPNPYQFTSKYDRKTKTRRFWRVE